MTETKKQIIDQIAHSLWGLATGVTPFVVAWGIPFAMGWAMGLAASCFSAWYWSHRERNQFYNGAHVWWDPLLDNGVFWVSVFLGAVAGGLML